MELNEHQLGLVFTGWGILVAVFSVFGAPRLQARFGIARTLYANLVLFSLDILVIALFTSNRAVVICGVIVAGVFIGVNNTVTTQAVMTVSPVERPIASASYGFIRFIGGGLAPFAAGRLAEHFDSQHAPFYLGAAAVLLGAVILTAAHRQLGEAERAQAAELAAAGPATARRERLEESALAEDLGSAT
ncbi:MFS transporter [Microbispora sp. H10670]|uniref:MFS transporter n=1 Tax=Microbispora sp. H10670 TaxID=2729108 RepID=UPI0021761C5C|nr:MFS transporter [Microbispora sp. H10670]